MIVGLTGKMGAGKNEAAKRLALLSAVPVVEVSYAKKLKESVSHLFKISLEEIEQMKNNIDTAVVLGDWHGPEITMNFRTFLQRYGTEAHRDVFGQDFWLDAALPLLYESGAPIEYDDRLYVVTDVRFANEAERIWKLGGTIVRVIGPDNDTGSHASETQIIEEDWILDNTVRDDNFAELDENVRWLLYELDVPVVGVAAPV